MRNAKSVISNKLLVSDTIIIPTDYVDWTANAYTNISHKDVTV